MPEPLYGDGWRRARDPLAPAPQESAEPEPSPRLAPGRTQRKGAPVEANDQADDFAEWPA